MCVNRRRLFDPCRVGLFWQNTNIHLIWFHLIIYPNWNIVSKSYLLRDKDLPTLHSKELGRCWPADGRNQGTDFYGFRIFSRNITLSAPSGLMAKLMRHCYVHQCPVLQHKCAPVCIFLLHKWYIVGYLSKALWDFFILERPLLFLWFR